MGGRVPGRLEDGPCDLGAPERRVWRVEAIHEVILAYGAVDAKFVLGDVSKYLTPRMSDPRPCARRGERLSRALRLESAEGVRALPDASALPHLTRAP